MFSLSIAGIAFLFLLILYKHIITPAFLSPLAKIPNAHFSSPISSLWIRSKRRTTAGTRAIYALHKKHGPAVRLGPNELSICTPGALRTIYIGGFQKSRFYLDAFVNYGVPPMVSMLEHKPHSVQKRMVSNVYSKSYLQNSEDLQTIANHLIFDRFLPILESVAEKGIEMDVLDFLQAVGMDFTSAYLFGLPNGTDFMNNVKYRRFWLQDYKTFKNQLPAERAGGEVERSCLSMCEAAERFINSGTKFNEDSPITQPVVYGQLYKSLRDQSLQSDLEPKPQTITTTAASEMLDHLIAGHETSGITLTYLLHELSQRPHLQSRLRAELLTLNPPVTLAPSPNNNNTTTTSLPSPRTIDALPLLDSLLRETLRLYAAAPSPLPRITPATSSNTGTTIEGYTHIPGGVTVSANAYTLHRNGDVFPEPETWIGERWMDASEEMRRWWWPFASGGRMCLGSNFAIQGTFITCPASISKT